MQESSTKGTDHPSVLQFRQDLETQLRQQVREAIETVLQAKLTEALGSARHERSERRAGYRHGHWSGPSPRRRAHARCAYRGVAYTRTTGDEGVS